MRRECGSKVLCAPALRPDTGQQEDRARHEVAQLRQQLRARRSCHGSDIGEARVAAHATLSEVVDDARELLAQRSPLGFVLAIYLLELAKHREHRSAWRATGHAIRAVGLNIGIELVTAFAIITTWAVAVYLTRP